MSDEIARKTKGSQVLHMNKGSGETSYARNSTIQKKLISMTKPMVEAAVAKILGTNFPQSMGIADLGCSSGPNAFEVILEILAAVHACCTEMRRPSPELSVFLNDLFTSDFNTLFASLPALYSKVKREEFCPCFVSGMPGSFYGRLFPRNSLHLVHSSSSLHWLSKAPPCLNLNKGELYISKTTPRCVVKAYSAQFHKDFWVFLRSRSEETVAGGRMVLSFMGRGSDEPRNPACCCHWQLLSQSLKSMVHEGLVKQETVDSFNAPYYAPCMKEIETQIRKEGSFQVDRLESYEVELDGGAAHLSLHARAQAVAKTVRAVVEPMLESHFGEEIMNELFTRYVDTVENCLSRTRAVFLVLAVSVVKKT